jgi:hypothetical protein
VALVVEKEKSDVEVFTRFSASSRDAKPFTNELVRKLEVWYVAHFGVLGLGSRRSITKYGVTSP